MSFAFVSKTTFAQVPRLALQHKFGIAGIAWDGAVTNRPGARFGPRAVGPFFASCFFYLQDQHNRTNRTNRTNLTTNLTTNQPHQQIRQSSEMLCDGTHPVFDVTLDDVVGDAGDLALPNTSLEAMRTALMPQVRPLLARHRMAWLGGDHSVTLPLLRAYREHSQTPLMVVHFDAHCDTWSDHFGEPSGHGTWVYEAVQEGLVLPTAFVQIGIRSPAERAAREYGVPFLCFLLLLFDAVVVVVVNYCFCCCWFTLDGW